MSTNITIVLNTLGDFYKDLHLFIESPQFTTTADTYLFLYDKRVSTNASGYAKVVDVLLALLAGWERKIIHLERGNTCFLPFDFSDQYIGCFKIFQSYKDELHISYGDTLSIQGLSINPSDIDSFNITEREYNNETNICAIEKNVFIALLNVSINQIALTDLK